MRPSAPPGRRSLSAGGSISHHHGVGRDHIEFYEREIGPLGVADAARGQGRRSTRPGSSTRGSCWRAGRMSAFVQPLAELIVRFGANVQPGQIVALATEPGKEALTRAVAEVAYEHGAQFVDVSYFDPCVKRARMLHADPETLGFVPPWYGERGAGARRAPRAPGSASRAVRPGRARGARPGARRARHAPGRARERPGAQRSHDELDGGAVPDPGMGRSSCTPTSTQTPRWRGSGSRSPTSAGSTHRIRSRPGRSGSRHSSGWAASSTALALDAVRFDGPGHRADRRPVPRMPLDLGPDHHSRRDHARSQPPDRGGVHHPGPGPHGGGRPLDQAAVGGRHRRSRDCGSGSRTGARSRSMPTAEPARCARSQTATRAPPGSARSRSSTARAGSGRSRPSSTTLCSTRTRPATSPSGSGLGFAFEDEDRAPAINTQRRSTSTS